VWNGAGGQGLSGQASRSSKTASSKNVLHEIFGTVLTAHTTILLTRTVFNS
jgi:hypothetical protein